MHIMAMNNAVAMFLEGAPEYFVITKAMVQPIVDSINTGLTTMLPIGITVMASFVGINVVKRVLWSFI